MKRRQNGEFEMINDGINGFLGTRASLMLDVVFVAMFLVVPVLGWSIWQVKYRRRFLLHKRIQLILAGVLLLTVALFEIDMRFVSGWRDRAAASPYFESDEYPGLVSSTFYCGILGMSKVPGWVFRTLMIHLCFAISTTFLWFFVTIRALRNFPAIVAPGKHSASHRFWGILAALDMLFTAVSGWIFYWVAFVA